MGGDCVAEIQIAEFAATADLPQEIGQTKLLAAQPGVIVSVAPFAGQDETVSALLKKALGVGLPATGRYADGDAGRILWSGYRQWYFAGNRASLAAEITTLLAGKAATTDQSDGWIQLALIGASSRDVMARLCPLDLSAEQFGEGSVARTELNHMMVMVTAIPGGFGIFVMRSFTASAVKYLQVAMASVAAQS